MLLLSASSAVTRRVQRSCCCLETLWATRVTSSLTLDQKECDRLRLERFSSVESGPTITIESSVHLTSCLELSADGPQTA